MRKQRLIDNRFKIGKQIGSGGMGEVFEGQDLATKQPVAIKSLRDEVVAQEPSIVERFEREGEALRVLNHPNIVKVIAAVTVETKHYIVMEYVAGGSLADLLVRQRQVPLERVREIALDLADALARAHRLRIIHRDIKPANVLLADDGTPRLSDFGIARIGNLSSLTETGATIGTYPYLSPEACNGEALDERTDIWAFGVLLFEMIAGRRPFEGRDLAILNAIMRDPVPDLELFRSDVPPAFARLVYRMLEKDRNKRIASARQVGVELEQLVLNSASTDDISAEREPTSVDAEIPIVDTAAIRPPAEPTERLTAPSPAYGHGSNYAAPTIGYARIGSTMEGRQFQAERAGLTHSLDFDVVVESTASGFAVRVQAQNSHGDVDLKTQTFVLPFDLKELPRQRKNTADWVKLARIPRRRGSDELRHARDFGDHLFRQLFSGEVLAAYRTCHADLKPDQFLRVRLRVPDELISLPWELLYDAKEDQFLVLATDLSLVRHPRMSRSIKPLQVEGPLRVLAVLASPDDPNYQPIKLDRELRGIEAALNLSHGRNRIVLDVIRGSNTLLQLRERLRQPVHILHILCHGDLDEENGEGVLIFEDADGAAEPVNASLLRLHLEKQHGQTVLVLLNACLGALPVANDPFSSLGAALLQGGVPAVIAMQFELADDAAAELARIFYAELAAGMPVDLALREARLHLYGRYRTRLDWAVPVLFLRAEGGMLIERAEKDGPSSSEDKDSDAWLANTRAAITAAEQRNDWETAITLLEEYCRQVPQDALFKERLDRAHAEHALDRLARSAAEMAQGNDWEGASQLLDQIVAQRPNYRHPSIDLEALRQRGRLAIAYHQATALIDQGKWNEIIGLLQTIEDQGNTDIAALLTRARREKQAQEEQAQLDQLRTILLQADARNRTNALARLENILREVTSNPAAIELLASLIEQPHFTLDQRIRAATLAAQLGDTRTGVTTLPPAMAPITGGKLEIARYLVTTAQFGSFIDDGGYDAKQPWWRDDGKQWLLTVGVTEPEYWRDTQFGRSRSNHPVVGVCWFEAEAFCLWLTHSQRYNPEGLVYRLPSAAEWQDVAQGENEHRYPWGSEAPTIERANFDKQMGGTTPVGCFLLGATPTSRIYDLAGNVWEWTSTIYQEELSDQIDASAANNIAEQRSVVVRGGSWHSQPTLLRSNHYHYYSPDYDSTSLGFRVVRVRMSGE